MKQKLLCAVAFAAMVLALTGCASSASTSGTQNNLPKGVEVWEPNTAEFLAEESIPQDQQAYILFTYFNSTRSAVTGYDGKAVDWKRDSDHGAARVVLPAGKHRIAYKFTGQSWEGDFEFQAGHSYRPTMTEYWSTFVDVTNVPAERAIITVTHDFLGIDSIDGEGVSWNAKEEEVNIPLIGPIKKLTPLTVSIPAGVHRIKFGGSNAEPDYYEFQGGKSYLLSWHEKGTLKDKDGTFFDFGTMALTQDGAYVGLISNARLSETLARLETPENLPNAVTGPWLQRFANTVFGDPKIPPSERAFLEPYDLASYRIGFSEFDGMPVNFSGLVSIPAGKHHFRFWYGSSKLTMGGRVYEGNTWPGEYTFEAGKIYKGSYNLAEESYTFEAKPMKEPE